MDGNGYTPSLADIAAAIGGKDGFGQGGIWIFALIVLMAMFNGGGGLFGGGRMPFMMPNTERNATVGDIQRSTDFAALERQNNETVAAVRQGVYDTTSAVKDGNYNILGELRDIQQATNVGFAEMQKCCCETNRNIDSVRYDMANFASATQAAIRDEGAKTRELMQQNKIDALQARVNELYTSQQLCGIPRVSNLAWGVYPMNPGSFPCNGQFN